MHGSHDPYRIKYALISGEQEWDEASGPVKFVLRRKAELPVPAGNGNREEKKILHG